MLEAGSNQYEEVESCCLLRGIGTYQRPPPEIERLYRNSKGSDRELTVKLISRESRISTPNTYIKKVPVFGTLGHIGNSQHHVIDIWR